MELIKPTCLFGKMHFKSDKILFEKVIQLDWLPKEEVLIFILPQSYLKQSEILELEASLNSNLSNWRTYRFERPLGKLEIGCKSENRLPETEQFVNFI